MWAKCVQETRIGLWLFWFDSSALEISKCNRWWRRVVTDASNNRAVFRSIGTSTVAFHAFRIQLEFTPPNEWTANEIFRKVGKIREISSRCNWAHAATTRNTLNAFRAYLEPESFFSNNYCDDHNRSYSIYRHQQSFSQLSWMCVVWRDMCVCGDERRTNDNKLKAENCVYTVHVMMWREACRCTDRVVFLFANRRSNVSHFNSSHNKWNFYLYGREFYFCFHRRLPTSHHT